MGRKFGAAWAGLEAAMPASATAAASHRMVVCFMEHETRRSGQNSQTDTPSSDAAGIRTTCETARGDTRLILSGDPEVKITPVGTGVL
ncbi:hypothetical protein GCM10010168_92910 [Actinoplanes ianthinogenes]|uniref:Uncharacterized protein n=1 Tax=Actinoplanes ianthinogenes TaxID=122358 RepID=A0ABM7LSK9_9ACTN|nr:hypothetical protein Aiant_28420 [Actinoplanes ianthinogenes]GGR59424.1 hypothetical protein GCM10010168_92910 [Actinoplanes ianthinogenes]